MRNEKNSTESIVHGTDSYLQSLLVTNPLQEPVMRRAIHALNLPPGSRGLDVGCGIGLQAIMLAEAVGAAGHVTGVDLSPEFLAYARSIAEKAEISEQVSFQEGDMNNLQFDDDTFDWVWSANSAGYASGEPLPVLKELARVVKPGGSVIILAWSSQQLLPGYPVLEARLNATSSGIAPFAEGTAPELHFSRMAGWFRRAGWRMLLPGHLQAMSAPRYLMRSGAHLPRLLGCGGWIWKLSCQKGTGRSISGYVWLNRRILS
ncbi:MAG: class I SAM-dependent methyltransferase [Euryarchaeota archaeon]|nr:MAG: putative arsenite methyltransferase [ANME-2 cluster archaeon]MEA1863801.1 class I SAM-dependent methyltransferase [Euryarchaeota archaeon]